MFDLSFLKEKNDLNLSLLTFLGKADKILEIINHTDNFNQLLIVTKFYSEIKFI